MRAQTGKFLTTASTITLTMVGALVLTPSAAQAQLDEIVTTAQRREQNVQDVPLAVTAFSPDDIENLQIDEPLDLIQYVPNLYGGNNTGLGTANVYYLRGLGNTESIATFDAPVGTYVDEVYLARQNGNNVGYFDVESIEVLRGPQGTLFGRNTTGGAIITRTRKPSEEAGGFVEVGYGKYDQILGRASVDVPLSDTVLTKISAYYTDNDGFVDNLATGETLNGAETFGIRGDVRLLLGDNLTWDLSADYTEDSGTSILNYSEDGSPFAASGNGDNRVSNTGISTESGEGTLFEQFQQGQGLGNQNEGFSLTSNAKLDVGTGTFNFIASYRSLDQDFLLDFFDGGLGGQQSASGGFVIINEGEHEQVSLELKYSNSYFDGALDFISGLYYFNEENTTGLIDSFTLFNFPVAPGVFLPELPITLANRTIDNDLDSYAAYAQGDYHVTDQLTLTVGVRWTEEDKEIEYVDNAPASTGFPPADGGLTGDLSDLTTANIIALGIGTEQKKSLITPRFVLNYDWNDYVSTFVSATNGFKSGGWNARGTTANTILPFFREKVWNYEAGIRSVLLDNTLSFNATAFYTDVSDFQLPTAFDSGGTIIFVTQNFADLENKGIELDVNYQPNTELTLYASLGIQDAEYKNIADLGLQRQADCLASPTNAGGGQGIVAPDCSIAEPTRTPEYSLSIGGAYDFSIANGWNLTPSANVRFVGETFVGTANEQASFEDGYTLVNAGLALSDDDDKWRASLECKNCFDETFTTNFLAGTVYSNNPITWQATLRRNF